MVTSERTAHDFDELLSIVKALKKIPAQEYSDRIWFRGENKIYEFPIPSVYRKNSSGHIPVNVEQHYANTFKIRIKQAFPDNSSFDNYAAWMVLMQHYGVPTRMLDWTRSLLVAIYFAVLDYKKDDQKNDGAVYVLFPRMLNEAEGVGRYIPSMDGTTVQLALRDAITDNQLNREKQLRKEYRMEVGKLLACHPSTHDERIRMQQSAFVIQTSARRNIVHACPKNALHKIIIPHAFKQVFADGLTLFGITEGYIYPDFEHIAREVTQEY